MSAHPASPAAPGLHTVRIWDLPTRLFHWLLLALVSALVISAKTGQMDWHLRLGHAALALLLFRLLWGFAGGYWSRFARFVYRPGALLRYLRGQAAAEERAGHSPLGALSVFALLALLLAQVGSGLLSDDDIFFAGPLARFVAGKTVAAATAWHVTWGQYLLYALVALHLLAVIFYGWQRRGLTRAMLTGDKQLDAPVPAARDDAASRTLAAVLALLCAGLAWWVYGLGA